MKLKVTLLLLLLMSIQLLIAQTTPSQSMDDFIEQKGNGFEVAYEKKDVEGYNALLSEYLMIYENLSADDKKQYSHWLSNIYYNLSCIYSISNDKKSAITSLKKAIDAGYNDYGRVQLDSDLDNIRKEKDFVALNSKLKLTGDYLFILKTAKNYNDSNNGFPKFEYQSMSNPNLVTIRKELKLDSIAGTGSEISRILNLMNWLHYLIPHDGRHANPAIKNALNMITVCKKEGRGLNCRGLATVLNECYLSLGIKSRFITCLPKDTADPDCHVINMVYSNDLNKWIWIDPTMNAYVMNERGELLGIEEVRERLINGKPLILNPDANWNRQETQNKQYYLEHYMAKNLYRLECPIISEYDTETPNDDKVVKYAQLLSIDDQNNYIEGSKAKSKKKVVHKTRNPKIFWAKPAN